MKNITFCALPPRVYEITPKAYAGPVLDYNGYKMLKTEGISAIVDLRKMALNFHSLALILKEKIICASLGIKHKRFPIDLIHEVPDKRYLKQIANETESHNGKTYIHCRSGRHRAGIVATAIKILTKDVPLNHALNEMYAHDYWVIAPNQSKEIQKLKTKRIESALSKFIEAFSEENCTV